MNASARFALAGAVSGGLAVVLGAFGAHALAERLPPERLALWETAARYQAMHALALLAAAWAGERWPSRAHRAAGWAFVAGTVLFSGSLYLLALTGVTVWGAVTPFGGASWIAAWTLLGAGIVRGARTGAGAAER